MSKPNQRKQIHEHILWCKLYRRACRLAIVIISMCIVALIISYNGLGNSQGYEYGLYHSTEYLVWPDNCFRMENSEKNHQKDLM